jgi:hypothetical protein
MEEDQVHQARRRRRDFIRTHHPDAGGDADAFIAGIQSLDAPPEPDPGPLPPVFIVRHRAWPAQLGIAAVRRLRRSQRSPRVH